MLTVVVEITGEVSTLKIHLKAVVLSGESV
jgi:hypothetical protein